MTEALVRRVEAAGATALVLTVDAPLLGRRERDVKNRFALPHDLRVENMGAGAHQVSPGDVADSGLAAYFASLLDPSLSWPDVAWLGASPGCRSWSRASSGPTTPGARSTPAAPAWSCPTTAAASSTARPRRFDVLPAVAAAVGADAEVYVDGGVRRGTDVIKAIALGARAVLVGRPVLWGLAAGGRDGVAAALGVLRRELDLAMALCGCPSIAAIGPDLVSPAAS